MKLFITIAIFVFAATTLPAQIITTVAGNGTYGYSGNGGPATAAQLAWQMSIVKDNSGNLYIADHDNNVVRKVDAAGIITNFAGNGTLGYTGDGGPATAATVYHPAWLAMDHANNLYISDQNTTVIRKVTPAGIITSITGNLPQGYSGDGGPLMQASFTSITGIAFDAADNMYISDASVGVIRKVNATTGIINTIAGTGIAGYSGDGGPASAAQVSPYKVIFDAAGNMYIPDNGNRRIRKIDTNGIITTYAGNGQSGEGGDGGPAINAEYTYPWTIDIDAAGNIFVGDNHKVRKINAAGIISTYAGTGAYGNTGDGGPAVNATFGDIAGVCVDPAGNLFISVREYFNVIRKVNNCITATISQQPTDVTLCNTGNADFTATVSNMQNVRWQQNSGNGWQNISDNATYSGATTTHLHIDGANTLMNNFLYRLVATNSCGDIFSQQVKLIVNSPVTPSVSIATISLQVCAGETVSFTAETSNAGTSFVYQWKKNNVNVGTNANVYSDNTLVTGDQVFCMITTGPGCFTSNSAISGVGVMQVSQPSNPSVVITGPNIPICAGSIATFHATVQNGGSAPVYQWSRNNVNVGTNTANYTANNFTDGETISCKVTSNSICLLSPQAESNTMTLNVKPIRTPVLTITTPTTNLCPGASATFTAVVTGTGDITAAGYFVRWKKNGIPVSIGFTYTDASIVTGDQITGVLTIAQSFNCLTSYTAQGNIVEMKRVPDPVVALEKNIRLCTGSQKMLDAGNFTQYEWNDLSTNRTLSVSNIGKYYVTVTDQNGCKGSDTTTVISLWPLPAGFLPKDTSICTYERITIQPHNTFKNYLWNTGTAMSAISVSEPGSYWLQATDENDCKGKDTIIISDKECRKGFYVPTAFTPGKGGVNNFFKPLLFGNIRFYHLRIYNRWGQMIFETNDRNKGWDGKVKGSDQEKGGYVWICEYKFQDKQAQIEKGTILLLR